GGDAELHREAARLPDAALDLLGPLTQMHVARIQLRPGVEDGDHRLALVLGRADAKLAQPGPVAERAQAVPGEPSGRPRRLRGPHATPQRARMAAMVASAARRRSAPGRSKLMRALPPRAPRWGLAAVRPHARRLPITMLANAHRMPTPKIALPKTKTCGGMPMRVTPYTQTRNGTADPLTKFQVTKSSMDTADA